jgi:hypothetical protein
MPKNSNKRWTDEEDKRLLELAATGKPHVAIGAALKRSTVSVTGRLGVLKTMANRLSKAREAAEEYANDQRDVIESSVNKPLSD